MDYSKSPPPSVGTSTQIDYLHAILESNKALVLALGGTLPDSSVPTITMQVTSTEPVVLSFGTGTVLTKIKFYTGINTTVNISFGGNDNSDNDLSMNIENEVGLNYTFQTDSSVTITNLPINSTIKIYTK